MLSVSAAYGLPDHPAKPHRNVAPVTTSHRSAAGSRKLARHHAAGRGVSHPDVARLTSRSHSASNSHAVAKPDRNRHSQPAIETETPTASAAVQTVSLRKARVAVPPPLRGSYESLVRQNERSDADGLERIMDDDDLADRIAHGMLVPLPVSAALTVDSKLPENRRYCRPWAATFLTDLARAHAAEFHSPLEVSSAVRTVAYQKQLEKVNGNAAPADGEIASPHLTGATIDIAKQGMNRQQIGWMRARLLPLEEAGKIDVEEEFQQSCFHITVYKSYLPPTPARKPPAQATSTQVRADRSGL